MLIKTLSMISSGSPQRQLRWLISWLRPDKHTTVSPWKNISIRAKTTNKSTLYILCCQKYAPMQTLQSLGSKVKPVFISSVGTFMSSWWENVTSIMLELPCYYMVKCKWNRCPENLTLYRTYSTQKIWKTLCLWIIMQVSYVQVCELCHDTQARRTSVLSFALELQILASERKQKLVHQELKMKLFIASGFWSLVNTLGELMKNYTVVCTSILIVYYSFICPFLHSCVY